MPHVILHAGICLGKGSSALQRNFISLTVVYLFNDPFPSISQFRKGVVNTAVYKLIVLNVVCLVDYTFPTHSLQVGAAISMTYTTGQPIVFVGTGQRYTDIKSLNVQAVVSVLLK